MSGVYLYGIVRPAAAPAPPAAGIDDAVVELAAAGGIGWWLSCHEARPAITESAVRRHNDVVRSAMSGTHTPVPLRFGQWFSDVDAARDAVAADPARWDRLLDRFVGAAEYGVRIARREHADAARDVRPASAGSGTAYMAALARRNADIAQRRLDGAAAAAWLLDRIGSLARESRPEPLDAGDGLVNLALLVAWADAAAYDTVIAQARLDRADLRFLVSGPWPPYSFVS